ncbi:MAG: hypothetical protein WKG07_30950 [Hymenobacter sp.]
MKNALFILAGATAFSLASCSQEKTADTTTTTVPADGAVMTPALPFLTKPTRRAATA